MLGQEAAKIEQKLVDWKLLAVKWFHSRKALIFLLAFAAGCLALALHRIDGGQWVDLVKWSVGGYMLGNAGSAVAGALGDKDA